MARVTITLPDGLSERVEARRGGEPRSAFIARMVEAGMDADRAGGREDSVKIATDAAQRAERKRHGPAPRRPLATGPIPTGKG